MCRHGRNRQQIDCMQDLLSKPSGPGWAGVAFGLHNPASKSCSKRALDNRFPGMRPAPVASCFLADSRSVQVRDQTLLSRRHPDAPLNYQYLPQLGDALQGSSSRFEAISVSSVSTDYSAFKGGLSMSLRVRKERSGAGRPVAPVRGKMPLQLDYALTKSLCTNQERTTPCTGHTRPRA